MIKMCQWCPRDPKVKAPEFDPKNPISDEMCKECEERFQKLSEAQRSTSSSGSSDPSSK